MPREKELNDTEDPQQEPNTEVAQEPNTKSAQEPNTKQNASADELQEPNTN